MSRILVVGDDCAFVCNVLQGEGHEIGTVDNTEGALARLRESLPSLLILDLDLPGEDSRDILKALREGGQCDAVPVILLSGRDDVDDKVRGLDLGAIDYVVKPVPDRELAARVRAQLRAKQRHEEISLTDPLTGAYNRRALDKLLEARLAESTRYGIPVSCVMFDLDHFKRVNDTYGHRMGDRVLRETAALTLSLFRQEDSLIRYGGEEFLVILFHAPKSGACTFAERLRQQVAEQVFPPEQARQQPFGITLSAGIATHPEDTGIAGVATMITRADRRLYKAKRSGRNRVVWQD